MYSHCRCIFKDYFMSIYTVTVSKTSGSQCKKMFSFFSLLHPHLLDAMDPQTLDCESLFECILKDQYNSIIL